MKLTALKTIAASAATIALLGIGASGAQAASDYSFDVPPSQESVVVSPRLAVPTDDLNRPSDYSFHLQCSNGFFEYKEAVVNTVLGQRVLTPLHHFSSSRQLTPGREIGGRCTASVWLSRNDRNVSVQSTSPVVFLSGPTPSWGTNVAFAATPKRLAGRL